MKKIILYLRIIILIISFFNNSCFVQNDYDFKKIKTIEFEIEKKDYKHINFFECNDSIMFSAVCLDQNSLDIYNVVSNKKIANISLKEITEKVNCEDGLSYFIRNLDSIILIPYRSKFVFFMNKEGRVYRKIEVSKPIKLDNNETHQYNLYFPIWPQPNLVLVNFVPSIPVITFLDRNKYYSNFVVKKIIMTKDGYIIKEIDGVKWPNEYFDTTKNFRDFHPTLSYNHSKNEILISFKCSPKIFQYQISENKINEFNYLQDTETSFLSFNQDSTGSMTYIQEFYKRQSYLGNVIFCPYYNKYFRIYNFYNDTSDTRNSFLFMFSDNFKFITKFYSPVNYYWLIPNNHFLILINKSSPFTFKCDYYLIN